MTHDPPLEPVILGKLSRGHTVRPTILRSDESAYHDTAVLYAYMLRMAVEASVIAYARYYKWCVFIIYVRNGANYQVSVLDLRPQASTTLNHGDEGVTVTHIRVRRFGRPSRTSNSGPSTTPLPPQPVPPSPPSSLSSLPSSSRGVSEKLLLERLPQEPQPDRRPARLQPAVMRAAAIFSRADAVTAFKRYRRQTHDVVMTWLARLPGHARSKERATWSSHCGPAGEICASEMN